MWRKYSLADTLPFERESSSIELLIGSDFYLDLILPQRVEIKPGLYMLATKLGWVLSGRVSGGANNDQSEKALEPNMLVITYGSEIERERQAYSQMLTSQYQPITTLRISGNWRLLAYTIRQWTHKKTGYSDLSWKH